MRPHLTRTVEAAALLGAIQNKTLIKCHLNDPLFRTGDEADSVYFLQEGRVKISRSSETREAIIALAGPGDFIGEGCLIGERRRLADAMCLSDSSLYRIEKNAVIALLRSSPVFAEDFMAYLLSRNSRYQDDLEDQLMNSTEKRIARALLLLAKFGGKEEPLTSIAYISPETLARMTGTTRARVSQVMNALRSSGHIEYSRREITVRPSLLNVLLG